MKSFLRISIVFYAFAMIFSSCNPNDVKDNTIEPNFIVSILNEIPAVTYPATTLDFSFDISYSKGLSEIYVSLNGKELENTKVVFNNNPVKEKFSFSYTTSGLEAGTTLDFVINMTGVDGRSSRWDIPVFVLAAKPNIKIILPETTPETFNTEEELALSINITSETTDIYRVTIYKGHEVVKTIASTEIENPRNFIYNFSYTAPKTEAGANITFAIEVMDTNGNIVNKDFTVSFVKKPSLELDEYFSVTLGMNRNLEFGQFIDLSSGAVYKVAGIKAICHTIDIGLFWSNNTATMGMSIASPNKSNLNITYNATNTTYLGGTEEDSPVNWTTRNITEFKQLELTADQFADIETAQAVKDLLPDGSETVDLLQKQFKGYSFVFKTSRGKYGVVYILEHPGNNTGSTTWNIKVIK